MGTSWKNTIAAAACAVRKFYRAGLWCYGRHTPAVIVRLDPAIQYSEAAVTDSIGRGVLDAPLSRGMTAIPVLSGSSPPAVPAPCHRASGSKAQRWARNRPADRI